MLKKKYLDVVLETPGNVVNSWWTTSYAERWWRVKVNQLKKMQEMVDWPNTWRKTRWAHIYIRSHLFDVIDLCVKDFNKTPKFFLYFIYSVWVGVAISPLYNIKCPFSKRKAYLINKYSRSFLCVWKTKLIINIEYAVCKKINMQINEVFQESPGMCY